MKLQVLGTGCPKCVKLTQHTESAVRELGLEAEIVKVTDINEIVSFGVLATPALAVDGEVKVSGRLASIEEIKELLS